MACKQLGSRKEIWRANGAKGVFGAVISNFRFLNDIWKLWNLNFLLGHQELSLKIIKDICECHFFVHNDKFKWCLNICYLYFLRLWTLHWNYFLTSYFTVITQFLIHLLSPPFFSTFYMFSHIIVCLHFSLTTSFLQFFNSCFYSYFLLNYSFYTFFHHFISPYIGSLSLYFYYFNLTIFSYTFMLTLSLHFMLNFLSHVSHSLPHPLSLFHSLSLLSLSTFLCLSSHSTFFTTFLLNSFPISTILSSFYTSSSVWIMFFHFETYDRGYYL